MAALASVWLGVGCLLLSLAMVVWRPAMTDVSIALVLWFGSPGTMCIAGMVLWAHRKRDAGEPGVSQQRLQCKVAIGLAVAAAAVVYALIIGAAKLEGGLQPRAGSAIIRSAPWVITPCI